MEFLVASAIGILTAGGTYLVMRLRTFPVIMGISLLTYAVNVFLFGSGRLVMGAPPILRDGVEVYTDPLPQALRNSQATASQRPQPQGTHPRQTMPPWRAQTFQRVECAHR